MFYSRWRVRPSGAPRNLVVGALLYCCLLMLLSGCVSVLQGVDSPTTQGTLVLITPTPSAIPTPRSLNTNSEIAQALVQGMSLDQKLGQMVISEFYGAVLNND